jgi:chemotaxis protein histidine kinase CheA
MDIAGKKATVSRELIDRAFVAFRTIKGAAAHLFHAPMKNLSRAAEQVLSEVRVGTINLNAAVAEELLMAVSRLREMGTDVDRRLEIDYRVELNRLNALLKAAKPARS